MSKPEDGSCLGYEALAFSLKEIVSTDNYPEHYRLLEVVGSVPSPWSLVSSDELKLMLTNDQAGVFVKVYAPACEASSHFVSKAHAALVELSQLSLTNPILAPLARCGDILFFPLGQPQGTKYMRNFNTDEADQVKAVVQKHGLSPLDDYFGKLEIVRVGGIDYMVDPFSDTADDIFE
jgi:hypothetical protein